jgi:protease I
MSLEGKRVGILIEEFYQELEVWYPLLRLREAGAEAFTIGMEAGQVYKSKLGYPVKADYGISDVTPMDLAALIIPGGWAPDLMRRHPSYVNMVREMNALGRPIAAICHAGWMLCSAGIVKNRRATCFFSIKDDLINAGAHYVDEPVVVDGNLITSRVPDDLPAFCREILKKL